MTNPYSALGVSSGATDEQIKAAYRELVKQYSDDDARINELNDAYDQIMAERRTGGQSADYAQSAQNTTGSGYEADDQAAARNYTEIRQLIRANDILSAEQRLLAINPSLRGAEWNFLMGCVCQSKGWLDEAYRYFSAANSIDPHNSEYAAAYNRMTRERTTGGSEYNPYGQRQADGCMDDDACANAVQCMCLYSLCSNCCCGN